MREKNFEIKVQTSDFPVTVIDSESIETYVCNFTVEADVLSEDDGVPLSAERSRKFFYENIRVHKDMRKAQSGFGTLSSSRMITDVGYALGKPGVLKKIEEGTTETIKHATDDTSIDFFRMPSLSMENIADDVMKNIMQSIEDICNEWSDANNSFSEELERFFKDKGIVEFEYEDSRSIDHDFSAKVTVLDDSAGLGWWEWEWGSFTSTYPTVIKVAVPKAE